MILAVTRVWAAGSFTFFTYIGAVLRRAAAVGPAGLAAFLLRFGIAGLARAAVSGWLTDRIGTTPVCSPAAGTAQGAAEIDPISTRPCWSGGLAEAEQLGSYLRGQEVGLECIL